MVGGAYSGKALERSTSSGKSSALIGLVAEPSHVLREGIRCRTGSDWTRRTYASLTCCSGIGYLLEAGGGTGIGPNVLPILNRDQSIGVRNMDFSRFSNLYFHFAS